jgi:hypothetical protein
MASVARKCTKCSEVTTFRITQVSSLLFDFVALKTWRVQTGARAAEPALHFSGVTSCPKCQTRYFVNFRVPADKFLEAYEEHCPELYGEDEPNIGELFRRLEGPVETLAWAESVSLDPI